MILVAPGSDFQYSQCALVPLTTIADRNNLSHSGYIISQYRDVTFYCCFTLHLTSTYSHQSMSNDFSIELTLNGRAFNMEMKEESRSREWMQCKWLEWLLPCPQSPKCWILVYAILLTFCGNSLTQMLSSFPLVKIATLIRYQLPWV